MAVSCSRFFLFSCLSSTFSKDALTVTKLSFIFSISILMLSSSSSFSHIRLKYCQDINLDVNIVLLTYFVYLVDIVLSCGMSVSQAEHWQSNQ